SAASSAGAAGTLAALLCALSSLAPDTSVSPALSSVAALSAEAGAGTGAVLIALPEGGGGIAAVAFPVSLSVSPSLLVWVSVFFPMLVLPPTLVSASGAEAALPGGGNGVVLAVSVVGGSASAGSGPGIM